MGEDALDTLPVANAVAVDVPVPSTAEEGGVATPPVAGVKGGGGGAGRFLCGGGGCGRFGGVEEFDLEGLPGGAGGCDMVVTAAICM